MNEKEKEQMSKLENVLGSQDFYDWYNTGRYYDCISGTNEDGTPTRDDILLDLYKMLKRRKFFD